MIYQIAQLGLLCILTGVFIYSTRHTYIRHLRRVKRWILRSAPKEVTEVDGGGGVDGGWLIPPEFRTSIKMGIMREYGSSSIVPTVKSLEEVRMQPAPRAYIWSCNGGFMRKSENARYMQYIQPGWSIDAGKD
jgi:hypothetical protein